jgi:hypothetical protein
LPVFSGAEGMLEQAACDELLGGSHHVFPHVVRVPFLVEKCGSLLLGNGASMFVGQSQQMRKCDFGDHSFSGFLLGHFRCSYTFTVASDHPLKPSFKINFRRYLLQKMQFSH